MRLLSCLLLLAALPAAAAPETAPFAVTVEVRIDVPAPPPDPDRDPETAALLARMRDRPQLRSRITVAGANVRQEILSGDFVLPQGAVVLHQAGAPTWTVVLPAARGYLALDPSALIAALEGGVGIESEGYDVSVLHTAETRTLAGLTARKSVVRVTYTQVVPYEAGKVRVPQANDLEVWHTAELPAAAALEPIFLKYQRDRTGVVLRELAKEIGFPLAVTLRATQGEGARARPAPGALSITVTDVARNVAVPAGAFEVPAGYQKLSRNPLSAPGVLSDAAREAEAHP